MTSRVDRTLSGVLTIAAVAMVVLAVRREISPQSSGPPASVRGVFDPEWQSLMHEGVLVGNASAPIKIIEFVDFECPVCRVAHQSVMREAKKRYGDRMAVWYVHFPLANHRFARVAAQASECAEMEGYFGPFVDLAFAKQDSFGLKTWASYAHEVGITDTVKFSQCAATLPISSRIDSGSAHARRKAIAGTPTFFINGVRFDGAPGSDGLFQIGDSAIRRR